MAVAILVMGVSGCGKSTVGAALAAAVAGRFLDGDDYHSAQNLAHMAAGQPLTDAMRWPWLDDLGAAVQAARATAPTVFACSALKSAYRARLARLIPDLRTVYLAISPQAAAIRLAARQGHFMPAQLLQSQFATLEPPAQEAIQIAADQPLDQIIARLLEARLLGDLRL